VQVLFSHNSHYGALLPSDLLMRGVRRLSQLVFFSGAAAASQQFL
jgi:hypothetical protein